MRPYTVPQGIQNVFNRKDGNKMNTNRVFVLDRNKKPLMPCRPARARRLLKRGRAAVYRLQPFTIILFDRTLEECEVQPIALKFDPGSRVTGIALVASFARGETLIWAANLTHRGWLVKERLQKRRNVRRSRRSRKVRYRKPRFNRSKPKGWLAPSLRSRIDNLYNWALKLRRFSQISRIDVETARFDTQKMVNPEIAGVEYQQGTLKGYEIREYLLEKWGRQCAYCGKEGVPLQIEHIRARGRGGTERVSNLAIACDDCNKEKGTRDIREFLAHEPERLLSILAQAQRPLRDAAVMNSIRYAIGDALKSLGLPISFWTGGRTKMNRLKQGYPKDHWIDAACVGISGEDVRIAANFTPLYIKAMGRGNRQKCKMTSDGFPRTKLNPKTKKREHEKPRGPKRSHGFQTGDIVKGTITRGKNKGSYIGRITIRASGKFNLSTKRKGKLIKVNPNWKRCVLLQHTDGYEYSHQPPKTDKKQCEASSRKEVTS
jgi:5-methylcytosine-specific restriction endonuclease McrA